MKHTRFGVLAAILMACMSISAWADDAPASEKKPPIFQQLDGKRITFYWDCSDFDQAPWKHAVAGEIIRAVSELKPTQKFNIVCFKGMDARAVPADGTFVSANDKSAFEKLQSDLQQQLGLEPRPVDKAGQAAI